MTFPMANSPLAMRKRGYLCGENHPHVDSASLGPMAIAEGLDFASFPPGGSKTNGWQRKGAKSA